MTYIELINEFWKQNGFKPFGAMDTMVYMYLLHQCNIREWLNPFELQTRNLELSLGITRKMIQESKNRLKQRGLIDYSDGNRGKTPTYTILGLSEVCVSHRNINGNITRNINGNISGNIKETQIETQYKTKTKEKDIKEKPPIGGKKKSLSPAEQICEFRKTSENESYLKFLDWIEKAAPYVAHNITPLSEIEFEKLKAAYDSKAIMVNILNIENRKDLRKKYSSLYRTLLNWCKNGYNE